MQLLGGNKSGSSFWKRARVLPLFGRKKECCLFLGGNKNGVSFWEEEKVVTLFERE